MPAPEAAYDPLVCTSGLLGARVLLALHSAWPWRFWGVQSPGAAGRAEHNSPPPAPHSLRGGEGLPAAEVLGGSWRMRARGKCHRGLQLRRGPDALRCRELCSRKLLGCDRPKRLDARSLRRREIPEGVSLCATSQRWEGRRRATHTTCRLHRAARLPAPGGSSGQGQQPGSSTGRARRPPAAAPPAGSGGGGQAEGACARRARGACARQRRGRAPSGALSGRGSAAVPGAAAAGGAAGERSASGAGGRPAAGARCRCAGEGGSPGSSRAAARRGPRRALGDREGSCGAGAAGPRQAACPPAGAPLQPCCRAEAGSGGALGRKILRFRSPPPSLSAGLRPGPGAGAGLSGPGSRGSHGFLTGETVRCPPVLGTCSAGEVAAAGGEKGELASSSVITPPSPGRVVFLVSRGCGVCGAERAQQGVRGCWRRRGRGVFWNKLFCGSLSRLGMRGKQERPPGQVLLFPFLQCPKVALGCSKARLMLIRFRSTVTNLRRPLLPGDIIKCWYMMS